VDQRIQQGALAEGSAVQLLVEAGYRIVERNYRCKAGELDIVARDGDVLVFVEVKTRRSDLRDPWESLHGSKQSQVRRMAVAWLTESADRPFTAGLRFDGVAVLVDSEGKLLQLDHMEAAF
jgi:putative endonuclease